MITDHLTLPGLEPIYLPHIIWLEGYGNYTRIHRRIGWPVTVPITIGRIEPLLPPEFLRCHKKAIINLNYVQRYERLTETSAGQVTLDSGVTIPVSKRRLPDTVTKVIKTQIGS